MEIRQTKTFTKKFNKRVPKNSQLYQKFNDRLKVFIQNRKDETLKDHALVGSKQGLRPFSINGDTRVIYYILSENIYVFVDIVSHNQVYS